MRRTDEGMGEVQWARVDAFVGAAYALMTLALTFPLPLRLATSARDHGDPLLNSWIMAWQLDRWASLDFAGYFDTNVFYPHLSTLAYSEFLVPQTLVAAPLYYLTGNGLLAHNVVMLLAFTLNAWCAYLLVRHLTGDRAAAFVGGVVFAFNPFMFDHLSHLQVISAAGIPLAFLWLHRYFETGSFRYMAFFTATYVAQALANGYYAVYLTYAAGAYILYRVLLGRRIADIRLWAHLAVHGVVSAVLLAPFFMQWLRVRESMGFRREMVEVSGWPLLAVSPINRLYGDVMSNWAGHESKLFPGFCAALLVLLGVALVLWERARDGVGSSGEGRIEWLYRALGWAALIIGILITAIATTGGFYTEVLGIRVSARHLTNPTLLLLACLGGRAYLRHRSDGLRSLARRAFGDEVFYLTLLVVVVVLSMGGRGPYRLLFAYAPGFDAMRAVPRIHVLSTVAIAVLAGIALRWLRGRFPGMARPAALAALAALVALVVMEYVSVPIPLFSPGPAPDVERWLAEMPGDYAVVFYPMINRMEARRMYGSLRHERNMINGISGFPAPVYAALRRRGFPAGDVLDDLETLGVRYVIVDQAYYQRESATRGPLGEGASGISPTGREIAIRRRLRGFEPRLQRVAELGDFLVYELEAPWLTRPQLHERLAARDAEARSLPRDGWRIRVSENDGEAHLAVDGDPATRWRTRQQESGMWISVDLGAPQPLAGVTVALGQWQGDSARAWEVRLSRDGIHWWSAWRNDDYELPAVAFLEPRNPRAEARFDALARHVRLIIRSPRENRVWSVAELDILAPGDATDVR